MIERKHERNERVNKEKGKNLIDRRYNKNVVNLVQQYGVVKYLGLLQTYILFRILQKIIPKKCFLGGSTQGADSKL